MTTQPKYQVGTFRKEGLEAKWSKDRWGRPYIAVRNPNAKAKHQRESFWTVDRNMWEAMQRDGIVEAFTNYTLLGDLFSV